MGGKPVARKFHCIIENLVIFSYNVGCNNTHFEDVQIFIRRNDNYKLNYVEFFHLLRLFSFMRSSLYVAVNRTNTFFF